jgi:hypothetical protein
LAGKGEGIDLAAAPAALAEAEARDSAAQQLKGHAQLAPLARRRAAGVLQNRPLAVH